nr:ribonuclease H-like domain-containing protein [Tanacetum cinerariifolium]
MFKDTTLVVSKTRFSVRTVQSKSLDTTPIVSKAKIVTDTPLSAKNKVVQIVLWIVYSGCSKHMTSDRSLLKIFVEKFMGTVRFGNDHFVAITGYGDYVQVNIMICNVYYVEGLGHNLFSVGQFYYGDLEVAFRSDDGVTTSFQRSQNSRPPMLDHQDKYMMKAQVALDQDGHQALNLIFELDEAAVGFIKLTTSRLVNGSSYDGIDMVIKDLDLDPKNIVVEFFDPSRGEELSKETSIKILPCCDGSCWKMFKPIASLITKGKFELNMGAFFPCFHCQGKSVLHQPDGVRSKRYHVVPYGELAGFHVAFVPRIQACRTKLNYDQNLTIPRQRHQRLDAVVGFAAALAVLKPERLKVDKAQRLVSNFMASQDARLFKFEADFKQQQSEMTNKADTVLKAITDRTAGALPSDTVIVNGNSVTVVTSASAEFPILPKTTEQKLARKNKLKAKSTLMLAILDDHLLKFHACKDAKSFWEAIKNRFGGNKESKKMQKTILKQNYENFVASSQEGLDKTYDRFQKLTSQFKIHGEVISQKDANLKLLRSLPSTWNNIALIMLNKSDLDTLSMDDLYNNLKVYESEIKSQSSSRSISQNVAFVSSNNTSNTNEIVNTAHSVSAASSKDQASTGSYADDVMFSFFFNQSNALQLNNEYLE